MEWSPVERGRIQPFPFNLDNVQMPAELRKLLASMNNSTVFEPSLGEPPAVEWMILHHCLTILMTLFGNVLLVYVILKNNRVQKRRRVTPVQILMLHMCAADVLFAVITVFPTMLITATVPNFYGPDILCKTVKFLQVFPMYASSFLLVAISADRYQAICRPLASMRSSAYNRPSLYAAAAWSAAFLFSTPQLALFHKMDGDCLGSYTSPYQYITYVIVFNTVVWLLPSAIAGYLYYGVCQAVWQSVKFSTNCNKEGSSAPNQDTLLRSSSNGMSLHHQGNTVQCVELDRRRVLTVKLTLTIVAANFILWAPFCVTSVVDAIIPELINPTFATYIMFFGNLNSCMNPWIWFNFNRNQLVRAISCKPHTTDILMSDRRVAVNNTELSFEAHHYST